jgi:hypothetical protein
MHRETNWKLGVDNRSPSARIAEGCVRDAVNFQPTDAGTFALRPGFKSVYAGVSVRAVFPDRDGRLLVVDGSSLVSLDPCTMTSAVLAAITPAGAVVAGELNGETFIASAAEMLRHKNGEVKSWRVPSAPDSFAVVAGTGNLSAGLYRLACTFVDEDGRESGVLSPQRISLQDGSALTVSVPAPPAGYGVRLYAGPANGETLYLQCATAGQCALNVIRDDSARLTTIGLAAVPMPTLIDSVGARLVLQVGKVVILSRPFHPHLHDPAADFFQYDSVPSVVLPCGAGIFICAGDGTYFISGIDSDSPMQVRALDYGAVSGTGRKLPDGRVAWMTRLGIVIGTKDGQVSPIASDKFVPRLAERGATGLVNSNGSSVLVTTMRGSSSVNPLAARDYFDAEVINP